EALADNTRGALPHALRVGVMPEHVAHNGHEQLGLRANHLVDHGIQRPSGLRHLARHQLSVPGRPALIEEAEEMGANKGLQSLLHGRLAAQPEVQWIWFRTVKRVVQHRRVEAFLVTKVIIDGSEIRLGPLADITYCGHAEAPLGEHFTSGLKQALTRFRHGWIGACGFHGSNLRFKRLYETII